ncbi:hypothetical protein BN946_scf184851.g89 [Trametes cinnabarina]|uniref:DNA polymerase delta subunit 4 n=1 Tax=Pycnoporus cinnabarinus TaxID=5643 RepID=A0A060S658_PYCCI|nr:hypothetical protein BN946_scf184851.g89 [Trametes cinnabarina]
MPRRRNPDLKQARLSFASKRNSSTAAAATGKKASSTKSAPSRTSSRRVSPSPASATERITNIIDSDSDASDVEAGPVVPAAKKRRLNTARRAPKTNVEVVDLEPELEKEPLNPADKRWSKAYAAARAKRGNLQAVHAEGQTAVHHILRAFDLSYEYGPCVGMSRIDRWERAQALGLDPPPEVKEILLTKEGSTDEQYTQSVFHGEV